MRAGTHAWCRRPCVEGFMALDDMLPLNVRQHASATEHLGPKGSAACLIVIFVCRAAQAIGASSSCFRVLPLRLMLYCCSKATCSKLLSVDRALCYVHYLSIVED